MNHQSALDRVRADIEIGRLGKARDRLHGLIAANPNDLSLRSMLAEILWRLQFPEMAGRYWYLEERSTPVMEQAVAAFENSVHSDPVFMLRMLKFRGDVDQLPEFARRKLLGLQQESLRKYGEYPRYGTKSRAEWVTPPVRKLRDRILPIGCMLLWTLSALLAVIGLIQVIRWLL